MKRTRLLLLALAVLSMAWPSPGNGQSQTSAVGHWEGTVDLQGNKLDFSVDIVQGREGAVSGIISFPSQNIKASPLINVVAKGADVSFAMQGIPGDPSFKGKLSDDGKMITGDLTQAGTTFQFKLERKGEAKSELPWQQGYGPTPSKGVPGQGIEGRWQGTLDAGGMSLRVVLKVTKATDGSYTARVDSPDQSVPDMVVDSITLNDKSVAFEMKAISGSYKGTMSADGSEVVGEWMQGAGSLPLTLKRLEKK